MADSSTRWYRRHSLSLTLFAFALLLVVPGPSRSPFSGVPFSSKAHLAVGLFVILVVTVAFFRPRQQPSIRWPLVLLACTLLKLVAFSFLIPAGWQGTYWTAQISEKPERVLRRVLFFSRGPKPFRVDDAIDFVSLTFGLHYVNDTPPMKPIKGPVKRDVVQPLLVIWNGWTDLDQPRTITGSVSANGSVTIASDGQTLATATNPRNLPLTVALSAGRHFFTVRYVKRAGEQPDVHLILPNVTVTPFPASAAEVGLSRAASAGILFLGLCALAALALALRDAYRPLLQFALEDIWLHVDRIGAVVFFAYFLLSGIAHEVPLRRVAMSQSVGDDMLIYEAQARQVLMYGLSMTDPYHPPSAYYFYPLYSYALAGAHALFGEDFATIILFNIFCVSVTGLLAWALLHEDLEAESVVAALFLLLLFAQISLLRYAGTAFSDNLYVPMTLLVVLAGVKAFEKRSLPLLALTGILTALGGATRPSLLILLPFMLLCVAFFWPSVRRISGRSASVAVYALGFAAGIAPFTIRNWVVAHKLVLVIRSYVMLPWFLYPPGDAVPGDWIIHHSHTVSEALRTAFTIFRSNPPHFLWGEVKKVLFTLGIQRFDPAGIMPRYLIFIPLLFAVAVWTGRIPRWTKIVILFFCASHLAAMVIASPYTYGYKTILPFHLILGIGAAFLLPLRNRIVVRERRARAIATAPERRTVSVILPTYNEKDSIRQVIVDFFATGAADEVLVINNNAAPGTSEEVAGTGAREIFEPRQGYGAAIRRGLREAKGDYIVVCEPDGTFVPRDILKLLAYADDFDVVYGSRTSQQMVLRGANMGFFLRWGNWAVAKYLEFLYNATSLTDVGCTMRLIRREVADELDGQFRIDGNQFGPEMMILTLRGGYRVVQVPVNYCERVGVSSVTGDPGKALLLGLQMIWLISTRRFEDLFVRPAPGPAGAELDASHGQ